MQDRTCELLEQSMPSTICIPDTSFWAIFELLGHNTLAGRVTDIGHGLFRVEVPVVHGPAPTDGQPSPDDAPERYECVECSRRPGAPTLCDRCLAARSRATALRPWLGPRYNYHPPERPVLAPAWATVIGTGAIYAMTAVAEPIARQAAGVFAAMTGCSHVGPVGMGGIEPFQRRIEELHARYVLRTITDSDDDSSHAEGGD